MISKLDDFVTDKSNVIQKTRKSLLAANEGV